MAVTCGFFNALEHDRLYDAIQMSSLFDGIIQDGIFSTIGTSMAVTAAGSGLVVNVGSGRAWFNHTWILNDTAYPIEADAAEVVLDRIDAVIIEVNASAEVRDCSIKFLKGTPSSRPVRPTLTHNAEVNQYALAYVNIRAGQTTIFQADITSVIGNDETPFVTGLLQQTSIESIVAQWQDEFYTYFNNFRSTTTTDFNNWMAARVTEYNAWYAAMEAEGAADLAEFDSWFQEMKDQLSEDAAGHLQAEIDALELSAEKGSVVIVTTSDDTLINRACTITQGQSVRTATFDINKTAHFESIPFVGDMNISATNGTLIASKDINIPYFGRYTHNIEFWEATILISSSSSELWGRPITISKGGAIVGTTSFDNTGHATYKVHEPGTYTISSTTTGGALFTATVVVTEETSYPIDLGIPIGATALPTDDIQLWLACGGEYDYNYITLAEVLADTELFARLCADSNACDYMARSTTWALAEGLVPVMTSNTTPEGEVSASSYFGSGYEAYRAFNDDAAGWDPSESGFPQWVQYESVAPRVVNRIKFKTTNPSSPRTFTQTLKVQGSNNSDFSNPTDLLELNDISVTENTYYTYDFPNNTAYKYHRFVLVTSSGQPSAGNGWKIQFYEADITTNPTAMQIVGMFDYCAEALLSDTTWSEAIANSAYFESILNTKVPNMTSNTTPSGEAFASSAYSSQYDAYRAFANEGGWTSADATANQFVGYDFVTPFIGKIAYLKANGVYGRIKNYKIEASVDRAFTNPIVLYTGISDGSASWESGNIILDNYESYRYYRVYIIDNYGASQCGLDVVQFYGRAKTVEYVPLVPTMTSNTTPSGEVICDTSMATGSPVSDYYQLFDGAPAIGKVGLTPATTGYQYYGYNFGRKVAVNKVDIWNGQTSGALANMSIIASDDGITWNEILAIGSYNNTATCAPQSFTIDDTAEYNMWAVKCQKGSSPSNALGGIQFYAESEGITIHSAANDTIYYLDGGTPVTVAVTDANGKAVIDAEDLEPGTYTFYSTVAKNPSNVSDPYSQSVKINNNTTEIYLMPIGVIYWYGYLRSELFTDTANKITYNTYTLELTGYARVLTPVKYAGSKVKLYVNTLNYPEGYSNSDAVITKNTDKSFTSISSVYSFGYTTITSGSMVEKDAVGELYHGLTMNTYTGPYGHFYYAHMLVNAWWIE